MIYLLLFLLLLLFTLAICAYAYRIAFAAPPRRDAPYVLPRGAEYEPFHPFIDKSAKEMLGVPCEEVFLTAWDGTKLFARYYHAAEGAPVHIMMHGYKGCPFIDFCGGSKLARSLGHNVIVTDQRAHGKSAGQTITFGVKERRDCLDWIHYARNRFGADIPIFLWGISMGAATVLMAADLELPENVAGILADCPYSSPKAIIQKVSQDLRFPARLMYPFVWLAALLFGHFRLEESSAVEAVRQTTLPILLIHGEADNFVPHAMSCAIKEANPGQITFLSVPGAGHGLCYMVAPEEYEKAVLTFLQRCLENAG